MALGAEMFREVTTGSLMSLSYLDNMYNNR